MHNLAIKIEIYKKNALKKEEWEAKNREFATYEKALRKNPMAICPVDDKGCPMMKELPPPKFKPEYLICTASSQTHCFVKTGNKCPNCVNRSCSTCQNKCRFVCMKE
jgi:hypothetical protein